jgi:hypothetical protein
MSSTLIPGPAGPVADEVEPQIWPYRLPAGWRRVTGLDGPVVPAQERPDGQPGPPPPARPAEGITSHV